jgi:hypothetical protein
MSKDIKGYLALNFTTNVMRLVLRLAEAETTEISTNLSLHITPVINASTLTIDVFTAHFLSAKL